MIQMNTNPDFQHHRIDYATDHRDEIEHVPGILEEVLKRQPNKLEISELAMALIDIVIIQC